jgi:hypothetical protein
VLDVNAIRRRLEATAPGEWSRHGADVHAAGQSEPLLRGRDGSADLRAQADADAEFVAHVPADIAALLAALEQTRQSSPGKAAQ